MVFTSTFFSADEYAPSFTDTDVKDISAVELTNGHFDALYATNNTDISDYTVIPATWDFDTIMNADFKDGDATAGNIDFLLSVITDLVIKRKKATDFLWTTIYHKSVYTQEDLNINGVDITPGNGEYQYAAVLLMNANEGNYNTATVDISIDNLMIADSTGVWRTVFTDGFCNVTCVVPNGVVEPMHQKFPTVISNGETNYQTISVSAEFYPTQNDEGECDPTVMDDDEARVEYSKELLKFLTNKKTKILKNVDGRRWLVWVTTPPSDTADEYYKTRTITFECTEVGDPDSSEDLYYSGITDVSEEWW